MIALWAVIAILVAYLSGSVNYAIILTRAVSGKDIRELGNRVAGASNTGRSIGRKWGLLVTLLDGLKALVPLILARAIVFSGDTNLDFAILYAMGLAAILGHMKPVFYGFRGGGGVASFQGTMLFFIPVEYLASMLIGGTFVLLFVKNVKYRFTQWIPISFITLTPFLTLAVNGLVDVPLFAHISIGGHVPAVTIGTFVISFFMLGMNFQFMKERKNELLKDGSQSKGESDPTSAPLN